MDVMLIIIDHIAHAPWQSRGMENVLDSINRFHAKATAATCALPVPAVVKQKMVNRMVIESLFGEEARALREKSKQWFLADMYNLLCAINLVEAPCGEASIRIGEHTLDAYIEHVMLRDDNNQLTMRRTLDSFFAPRGEDGRAGISRLFPIINVAELAKYIMTSSDALKEQFFLLIKDIELDAIIYALTSEQ